MILLDKNSYSLLAYLLKLEEPETVMAISKAIKQSRRKIYYHLDKINEALPKDVPAISGIPRVGILLTDQQKIACQGLLEEIDDYSYVMSIEERMQLSLIYIAIAEERVTLEKLMALNDVSRNTILNDLHQIRQELDSGLFTISLQATKAKGYYLDCHPLVKIQYLNRLLYSIYTDNNSNFLSLLRDKLTDLEGVAIYFSDEVSAFVAQTLKASQGRLGKKINSQDIDFMLKSLPYHLLSYRNLCLSEGEKDDLKKEFHLIQQRKEYDLALVLAEGLKTEFSLELDQIERAIIGMLLLSYRKDKDLHLESHDYSDMRQDLEDFLTGLEEAYHLSFNNRQQLLNQLLMHCKALVYRRTYGIYASNPLTQEIKKRYRKLFMMTQSKVSLLEEAWEIKMNDDEIAYLTIHIGGELSEDLRQPNPPPKIVLVCDDGIGVQKLLMQQCKHHLPDVQIEAVLTSEQFYSVQDIIVTDLLVSTTEMPDTQHPILLVHPVLTEDDITRLIRFTRQGAHQEPGISFDQRLSAYIGQYVKDEHSQYALKNKIERLINQSLLNDMGTSEPIDL